VGGVAYSGSVDDALKAFLANAGILGPILVAVGWYVLRLGRENRVLIQDLKEIQEKRTADAQAVTERILDVTDRFNQISQDTQIALTQNTQAIVDLKEAIRDIRTREGRR